MDLSLAHLKKVLKFGILLAGIQFVGLQSGFAYTPSSLKDKYFTLWAYGDGISYWQKTTMTQNYRSEALVKQSITPSTMVDSNGDTYVLKNVGFNQDGAAFCILKFYKQKSSSFLVQWFYPWHMVNSSINCQTTPNLSALPNADDPTFFKNYIHNAFQACIAQEVGMYSNFLYVFCYVPPTRYMGISTDKDDEGILMLKISKSDLSIKDQKFYPGGQNRDNYFSFNHQRPRRDSDSYAFGAECGNYQAWVDTDDSGTDHVHLNWLALEEVNNFSTCNTYHLYNGNVSTVSFFKGPAGGRSITSRAIKKGEYTYTVNMPNCGLPSMAWFHRNSLQTAGYSLWDSEHDSPFYFTTHDRFCKYFTPCYDFCIIENGDTPIFCVLGLRSTSHSNTYLSENKNEAWETDYHNLETSEIVLILTSNTSAYSLLGNQAEAAENPQNIIYSTSKTPAESCSTTCGCYINGNAPSTYDGYGENQLFKNTHKLVPYTSESGTKYIIYCYCYPGKSKQLFLGYAPYIISNNKVQLLTKTEFKSAPSDDYPMGESFGDFTSCSRIISMDLKNGQLWITWTDVDDFGCYSFHIAAKNLVGE